MIPPGRAGWALSAHVGAGVSGGRAPLLSDRPGWDRRITSSLSATAEAVL